MLTVVQVPFRCAGHDLVRGDFLTTDGLDPRLEAQLIAQRMARPADIHEIEKHRGRSVTADEQPGKGTTARKQTARTRTATAKASTRRRAAKRSPASA